MSELNGDNLNERRLWNALGDIQASLRILLEDRRHVDERVEKMGERVGKLESESVSWKSVLAITTLMTAAGEAISRWLFKGA